MDTRTGDTGDTALVGGRRVAKDAPRIEAYGTVDARGRRQYRYVYLEVPKKNGKTSIAAAIMVVALIMNERPAAEALLIARYGQFKSNEQR
mgnify:CR=1 FL=1